MAIYTATVELNDDEETALLRAAAFFKMALPDFLDAALTSGIAHAERLGLSALNDNDAPDEDIPDEAPSPELDDPEPPASLLPAMAAAFDALYHDVLGPMIEKTQDQSHGGSGKGETVRMTINLAKEWVTLAAWLELHGQRRRDGDLSPIKFAIDPDPRLAHWHKAKRYIERELHLHFHDELHVLATHRHVYLHQPPPPRVNAQADAIDDDIPF